MVNAGPRTKKKDVNMKELKENLLKFVQDDPSGKMELDIDKAKKAFDLTRNIIVEAYAFGPEELKKYKIVEGKIASPLKNIEPPCLSGKGTVTIKKHYVDEYNEKYSNNQIASDSSLDVTFEDGKIILTKI